MSVSATFATSDSHGHLTELTAALQRAGLLDEESRWCGGSSRLWVLGDLLDRGPDGLGVIALVRRLVDEAAAAGGSVHPLLGNHEVIALGTRLFGRHRGGPPRGRADLRVDLGRNGGLDSDQDGIDAELFAWLAGLPAVGLDGDHLLMHSDTLAYLEWGDTVDDVNRAVREVLAGDDPVAWFDVLVGLGRRHEYAGRPVPRPRGPSSTRSAGSASSTATASSATSSTRPSTPTPSRGSTPTASRSTSTAGSTKAVRAWSPASRGSPPGVGRPRCWPSAGDR